MKLVSHTLEGIGPRRREQAHVVKLEPGKKSVVRRASGLFEPCPNVAVLLRTVAADARRNNIVGLGKAAALDSDDMVPRRRRCRTICTAPVKHLHDEVSALWRNGGNSTAPCDGSCFAPAPERRIGGVELARVCVGARPTLAVAHGCFLKPCLAAAAPCAAGILYRSARPDGWPGRTALSVPADSADVSAPVKAGSVDLERIDRPEFFAAATSLSAVCTPRDVAPVECAPRFYAPSHGAESSTSSGKQHNAMPKVSA